MERVFSTPSALLSIAIELTVTADRGEFAKALAALALSDPEIAARTDAESGQTIIGASNEKRLSTALDALRRIYRGGFETGAPQVVYRETLTKRVETDYTHRKQTGGTGQFARVKIIFEPNEPGAGSAFESKIVGGAIPQDYIQAVENGIGSVMGAGVLAGFPMIDVKATMIDGAFHDAESSVLAFEIASRAAFRQALRLGGSVLLEQIMTVKVTTPEDYRALVIRDLLSRRGQVQRQDMRVKAVVINAKVPLADMIGYADDLRSFSQGRGLATMRFSHYQAHSTPPDDRRPPPVAAAMPAGCHAARHHDVPSARTLSSWASCEGSHRPNIVVLQQLLARLPRKPE